MDEVKSDKAARELVRRVARVLQVIKRVNVETPQTSAFYVYNHGPIDGAGNLRLGAAAVEMIAKQIDAFKTGKPVRLAIADVRKRLRPVDLYPDEIVFPVNTRVKIATDKVRYYPDMFRGVRDISVQLFFSVGFKIQDRLAYANVIPLYEPYAVAIGLSGSLTKNIFLSQSDAETFKQRLIHLPPIEIALRSATEMYLSALHEHEDRNYLKMLKRLHQAYDLLRPAFSPQEQSEIESILIKRLQSDWAVVAADVVEQADMWRKMDLPMRREFIQAGTLDELKNFLSAWALNLETSYPEARVYAAKVRALISSLANEKQLPATFVSLNALGREMSEAIGPKEGEMGQLMGRFSAKIDELGFKTVYAYEIRNQQVRLLRNQLLESGLSPDKVNLTPEQGGVKRIGGYSYILIDKLDPGEVRTKKILFRSVFDGEPARKFELYQSFVEKMIR